MATIVELRAAMAALARDERVLFIGQSVTYPGQRAHETFADVPRERLIEMPIAEDFTIGFAIGLSLQGYVPLVFIPRFDFLLCAANQLVNHLDAMGSRYGAKIIVRTAIGSSTPLDPGPQHMRDGVEEFKTLMKNVHFEKVEQEAVAVYRNALLRRGSSVLVERMTAY